MNSDSQQSAMLTFGGHLEVFRKMLFRIILVVMVLAVIVFLLKEWTFRILLAPHEWDFVTYRCIEACVNKLGYAFTFEPYYIDLISTELASQFMVHISSSFYLALLGASPYILYELFRFVTPALYESEKKYSLGIAFAMYLLFIVGVLMNYFIVFPVSFRFLGTYQVDASVKNTITLASYISTFSTLTFVMGLVFQLPVIAFILAKFGFISSLFLTVHRRHAIIVIMIIAAIITPPDLFTLILVTIPLYLLYEVSILLVRRVERTVKE